MTRLRITSLAAVLSLSTACAGFETGASISPIRIDPRLNVGNMGVRNNYELRNSNPLAARASDSVTVDSNDRARRPVTPVLFWLGIGLTIVGGAGTIGTAAAGYGTERQLRGDFGGSVTVEDVRTLENRGKALNSATIAGVVVTVIGAVLAMTTYGVDYTRCGPLAPKKRRATAPPGRCAVEDSK